MGDPRYLTLFPQCLGSATPVPFLCWCVVSPAGRSPLLVLDGWPHLCYSVSRSQLSPLPGHHGNHFLTQFPVPPHCSFSLSVQVPPEPPPPLPRLWKHRLRVTTEESRDRPLTPFADPNFPAGEHSPLFNASKIQGFYRLWLCLTNNFQRLMACEKADGEPM